MNEIRLEKGDEFVIFEVLYPIHDASEDPRHMMVVINAAFTEHNFIVINATWGITEWEKINSVYCSAFEPGKLFFYLLQNGWVSV